MKTPDSLLRSGESHSRQIRLRIPILVCGFPQEVHSFKELTETIVVAAHGGLIILRFPVRAGQKVHVVNTRSGEGVTCTVDLVVGEMRDKKNVQIIFDHPSPSFWGRQFSPED